jgi:polysaccharide biosynthesis transport protein
MLQKVISYPVPSLRRRRDDLAGEPTIGISDIVLSVRRHRLLIGLCVLVACVLGAFYTSLAKPVYVATTQVFIQPEQRALSRTDAIGLIQLDSSQLESQVQVVKSERVARYVVRTLNLPEQAEFRSVQENSDSSPERIEADAIRVLQSRLGARRIGQSYVIEISFWAHSAETAVRVSNAITIAYIRNQLMERLSSSSEILEGRIKNLRNSIEQADQAAKIGRIEIDTFPGADARVISSAWLPLGRSGPSRGLVLAFAGMVGLLVGGVAAAIRSASDNRMRSAKQVEEQHGIPVIGTIPSLGKVPEAFTHIRSQPLSAFSNSLRRIKTELDIAMQDSNILCVGFVSASPKEGKSIVVSNVALAFASAGRRTLLIDGDITSRALSSTLVAKTMPKLSDTASGSDSENRTIVICPNLFFLSLVNDPVDMEFSDFIGSACVREIMASVRSRYDVVLVDLPALSAAADAHALSPALDAIVVVAKLEATSSADFEDVLRTLNRPAGKVIGTVLNGG